MVSFIATVVLHKTVDIFSVIIPPINYQHYNDVIMSAKASQITSLTIVYSTVYSGANQRKPQCSASLAFVRGIDRWSVNSPHKGPVTRKMFPFDDFIMRMVVLLETRLFLLGTQSTPKMIPGWSKSVSWLLWGMNQVLLIISILGYLPSAWFHVHILTVVVGLD